MRSEHNRGASLAAFLLAVSTVTLLFVSPVEGQVGDACVVTAFPGEPEACPATDDQGDALLCWPRDQCQTCESAGIVNQAVFLTFGTLGALLMAYKSGLIKATENFKLGVFAATGGIAMLYLISFVMSFFGSGIGFIHNNSTFGIIFSFGVVVIASLNLVLDFDFIEEGSEMGAPKYMEWYATFGLLVTLIWLYLEILRLLAKLQSRR